MSLYKGNGFVLADKAVSFFAAVFVLRPDNIFAPFLFFERGIFFPKNAHSVSMEKKFRLLKAEEIEIKIKQATEKGVVALVYKTSRVDMDILDETVGAENWADDYKEIHGNLYCGIGIRSAPNEPFVWKWDCGVESREDAGNEKKGEASDAFKRAGVKWGIGRELYTAPFIFLNVPTQKNGTGYRPANPYAKYDVAEVEYDNARRIRRLVVVDERGKTVFSYPRETGKGRTEDKGCIGCSLKAEDWEKIGYTEEQLEEVVVKMTGKKISELDDRECDRLRDWIDKVYEKRLSEQRPSPAKKSVTRKSKQGS